METTGVMTERDVVGAMAVVDAKKEGEGEERMKSFMLIRNNRNHD